jgi:hypothetical protein
MPGGLEMEVKDRGGMVLRSFMPVCVQEWRL